MAQITCKYHPQIPARWYCPSCQINYCKSCMPSDKTKRGPYCTVCKERLQSVGTGNAITPFWIRSGKFFLYPLHWIPLSFLIILTVLNAQFDTSLMGKLIQFAISIVFMKYAYAVLENTALGHLKPLPINANVINEELELPFKQILLIFAIGAANVSVFKTLGFNAFAVTVVISSVAFPANVMVLAMEHSFFSAFNPILVISLIKRIGAPYFLLTFLLLMLLSASGTMMNVLYSTVSYSNFVLISSFVSMYFMLTMSHLMGYTIYQYHEQIGYIIEQEDDEDVKNKKKNPVPSNPELRHFEILLQEGKTEEASQKITQIIRENPADHDARMLDLKFQKLLGDMPNYEKHAKKYISYLVAQDKLQEAAKTLNTILITMPTFKPENANERYELAIILKQAGQNKAAVSIVNNLHIDFPDFKKLPEAYFMAAKILCDNLGNDKQAKDILKFLLLKYPDSELKSEIKEYINILNNLSSL